MKRILRPLIYELGLKVYKKLSPQSFRPCLDLGSDIDRIVNYLPIQMIFDVGANIGDTALYFSRRFPQAQIMAFEPVKATFAELTNNTQNSSRIKRFQHAFGSENGTTEIYLSQNSELNSLVNEINLRQKDLIHDAKSEKIEIKTIDDFCVSNVIDKIDLLKTDTEGFDLEVLKGAENLLNQRKIKFILSEVGFRGFDQRHTDFHTLSEYLFSKGFRVYGFYDLSYWTPYHYEGLIFCNALFVNVKAIKASLEEISHTVP